MATKKKTTGAVVQRKGEPLSIRIDPKVRYGLELLARRQRRSVTGVVEWSIVEAFRNETISDDLGNDVSFEVALEKTLWALNEPERLLRLYFGFQSLMTFDEERMAGVLLASKVLWSHPEERHFDCFEWSAVLDHWETLRPKVVAASQKPTVMGLSSLEVRMGGLDGLVDRKDG